MNVLVAVGGHAQSHNHGRVGCECHGKRLIVMGRSVSKLWHAASVHETRQHFRLMMYLYLPANQDIAVPNGGRRPRLRVLSTVLGNLEADKWCRSIGTTNNNVVIQITVTHGPPVSHCNRGILRLSLGLMA